MTISNKIFKALEAGGAKVHHHKSKLTRAYYAREKEWEESVRVTDRLKNIEGKDSPGRYKKALCV